MLNIFGVHKDHEGRGVQNMLSMTRKSAMVKVVRKPKNKSGGFIHFAVNLLLC